MFNIFNKIKKKAFEEGYRVGYKLAEADGERRVLAEQIDSYNRGFYDGSHCNEVHNRVKQAFCVAITKKLDDTKKPVKKVKRVKKVSKKKGN